MPDIPRPVPAAMAGIFRKATTLGAFVMTFAVAGCFTGGLTTRDYSTFQTYQFEQTPGLGFCGNTDQVFSAQIARQADGTMAFAHSVLALAGSNPENCENGVATDKGCYRAKAQPSRTLSPQEAAQVSTVFADVKYHQSPDRICRKIAVDPCMIERHAWDSKELSDYICGNDRLSDEQSTAIRKLLSELRAGG